MNENNNFHSDASSESGVEIDLLEVVRLLKRKIIFILLAAIVFAAGAYVYFSNFVSPKYTSNAKIFIDADYSASEASLAISLATNLAKDYPYIIKSNLVMNQVAENLELPVKGSQLLGSLNVSMPGEEIIRVIDISVTYTDPQVAADIANETIRVFSNELPRIAKWAKIRVTVIDEATIPAVPSSPNVTSSTMIAAIIGAVIMSAIFIVINVLDDKIKSEGDIEKALGLNVLATIPEYGDGNGKMGFHKLLKKQAKKKYPQKRPVNNPVRRNNGR